MFNMIEQRDQWRMPHVKPVGKGIHEVRISAQIAWRIFGYFGNRWQFTVCNIDRHVGKKGDLSGAIGTAKHRMTSVKSGKEMAVICERPGKS